MDSASTYYESCRQPADSGSLCRIAFERCRGNFMDRCSPEEDRTTKLQNEPRTTYSWFRATTLDRVPLAYRDRDVVRGQELVLRVMNLFKPDCRLELLWPIRTRSLSLEAPVKTRRYHACSQRFPVCMSEGS